jgi:hypothetical protein
MAARTGLSASTIGRIWRRFEHKPHVQDFFKLSTDAQFVGNSPASAAGRGLSSHRAGSPAERRIRSPLDLHAGLAARSWV